jgi:hypothetical protein
MAVRDESGSGFPGHRRWFQYIYPGTGLYAPAVTKTIHGAHSIYFQVLAEHGYVGLILYALFILFSLTDTHRLVWQARRRGDHLVQQYATMLRFSLAGFLISGAFLGLAYFDYFFWIVACLAILRGVARAEWSAASAEDSEPEDAPGIDTERAATWAGSEGTRCAI